LVVCATVLWSEFVCTSVRNCKLKAIPEINPVSRAALRKAEEAVKVGGNSSTAAAARPTAA
jgi:hypothetical protein